MSAKTTIARMIFVAALAHASGCAQPDWIEQTLVTVDVTGTWRSTTGGLLELALVQQGPSVKGSMRLTGLPGVTNLSGPIDGIVFGDTFNFRGPSVTGEMIVSDDEMTGEVRGIGQAAFGGRRPFTLQRVSSPAPQQQ